MTKPNPAIAALACAALITFLFHREYIGINLAIAEIIVLILLKAVGRLDIQNSNHTIFVVGSLITAIATVLVNSTLAITANLMSVFLLSGVLVFPKAKSIVSIFGLALCNLAYSQAEHLKAISRSNAGGRRLAKAQRIGIYIVPLLIILFFIWMYRSSNPVFDKAAAALSKFIGNGFSSFFARIDVLIVFTFILALVISNFLFFGKPNSSIADSDNKASDVLRRVKPLYLGKFNPSGLRREVRAGCFLLIVLNAILLLMNLSDIYHVWFNFTWNGEYLKQFVHEGTYLLLLSIICSIAIVLYFFRRNLNFYSKSKILRVLSYVWLAQNALLAISVGIRNYWYMNFYALAYKRIALVLFLILVLYGLWTVFIKVRSKKTAFYLFRKNALAVYVILVCSSLFNWDVIIVKYNFSHWQNSYADFSYNSGFSDKALPEMDKNLRDLQLIKTYQHANLPFADYDISPEEYSGIIADKKRNFKQRWESMGILSWNLPEHLAYQKLYSAPNQ